AVRTALDLEEREPHFILEPEIPLLIRGRFRPRIPRERLVLMGRLVLAVNDCLIQYLRPAVSQGGGGPLVRPQVKHRSLHSLHSRLVDERVVPVCRNPDVSTLGVYLSL